MFRLCRDEAELSTECEQFVLVESWRGAGIDNMRVLGFWGTERKISRKHRRVIGAIGFVLIFYCVCFVLLSGGDLETEKSWSGTALRMA